MTHIRFDPTINAGHLLTAGVFSLALLGVAWSQSNFQTATNYRLQQSEEARAKFTPQVEQVVIAQVATTQRFDSVGSALREVRDATRDLTEVNAQIRERIAAIETKLRILPAKTGSLE